MYIARHIFINIYASIPQTLVVMEISPTPGLSTQTICAALSGFSLFVCVFVSLLLFIELIFCDPIMIIDGYAESPLSPGSLTACSVGRLTASVDSLYNPDLVLRYTRQVMMFTTVAPGMPMLHRITNGTELTWKRIKKSR